jgi:putative ABC transport system permease protein
MLKAIGAGNGTVGMAAILQIVTVNAIGVAIGTAGSLALGATFPSNVPILFTGEAVVTAIVALLTIGPAGGLVSVFALLRVEPLRALGLAQ